MKNSISQITENILKQSLCCFVCFGFICIKSVLAFGDHIVHGTYKIFRLLIYKVRLDNDVRKGRRNTNSVYNDKNLFMKRKMYFARFSKAKHKDKRKSQHGYMDIFAKNYWYYWFFKHICTQKSCE